MTTRQPLNRQVERLLDEQPPDMDVEVIVQIALGRDKPERLMKAAGEALSRRRLSLSPRDLLPVKYDRKQLKAQERKSTSSARSLMASRATSETLALAKIQKLGESNLGALLKNGMIKAALARMLEGSAKVSSASMGGFWTSQALTLRLTRDELAKLPGEVPEVKSVHLNRHLGVPHTVETRSAEAEEEILVSTWGLEKIKALAAWGAHGARGKGVKIGLLDTGVDAEHPDLKGKIKGWAEFDSLGNLVPGSTPHDSATHGTHCAGTLVGGNASGRFIGVAPEATIAAGLVLDGKRGGTDAQVLAGIDWAVEQRVDIISLSLGSLMMDAEMPPTYSEAILTCLEAGIPVCVAIGNEGGQTTGSPGNDLFALSVGATDSRDRVAGFSGGRTQIVRESDFIEPEHLPLAYSKPDMSGPGVAILSSVPGGGYKPLSGTSMATPHVAGAIALLLSATSIRDKESGLQRAYTIQDLITGSVEDLGESGQDHRYGFGRLDVLRAIDFALERGYTK